MNLEGMNAVVTGGASGIGRASAVEMARRGANVVVADLHEARIAETVAEIEALGRRALGVRCDVASDADVDALAATACEAFGQIDVLMNNAGVAVLGPPHRVEMTEWERILQINVLGIVRGVRAFLPGMIERGRGYVVNTASIAGTWAYTWDAAPYITSKFAAYGYSETLVRAVRPHGIGVSVLCPGLVDTNLGETARIVGVPDDLRADWIHLPPDMMADMVDADTVGRQVCDGIEAEQFAIFTNERDRQRFAEWRVDIERSITEVIANGPTPPVVP